MRDRRAQALRMGVAGQPCDVYEGASRHQRDVYEGASRHQRDHQRDVYEVVDRDEPEPYDQGRGGSRLHGGDAVVQALRSKAHDDRVLDDVVERELAKLEMMREQLREMREDYAREQDAQESGAVEDVTDLINPFAHDGQRDQMSTSGGRYHTYHEGSTRRRRGDSDVRHRERRARDAL